MPQIFLLFPLGYVLGSIPTAYLFLRLTHGVDIRSVGSRNVGAVNSYEVSRSALVGFAVLLIDVSKGLVAVHLAMVMGGDSLLVGGLAAVGAVAGHNFSVWIGWKGGRGLATAGGALLGLAPLLIFPWMALWGAGYLVFRDVNMGNAAASLVFAVGICALPFSFLAACVGQNDATLVLRVVVLLMMLLIMAKLVEPVRLYLREMAHE